MGKIARDGPRLFDMLSSVKMKVQRKCSTEVFQLSSLFLFCSQLINFLDSFIRNIAGSNEEIAFLYENSHQSVEQIETLILDGCV